MKAKTVLVTGSSQGIGLEFIRQLAEKTGNPTKIIATCLDPNTAQVHHGREYVEELNELTEKHPGRVHVVQLDVTDDESIAKALEKSREILGGDGLGLLINNAGILDWSKETRLPVVSRAKFREHLEVNTISPLMVTQSFLGCLNSGVVVNISSWFGSISGFDGMAYTRAGFPYATSKAGQNMVSRILAHELKERNIIVVSICPGHVDTAMGAIGGITGMPKWESISAMLATIDALRPDQSGAFIDRTGNTIPY